MKSGPLSELAGRVRRDGVWGDWRGGPGLGAVLVSGADSVSFLHSQLTSDVRGLAPGEGQLSARLNRTGKLLTWLSLHRLPDRGQPFAAFILILPADQIGFFSADLSGSVISEDVVLDEVTGDFTGWVVQGTLPAGASDLAENGMSIATVEGGERWVFRRSFTGDPGGLVLTPETGSTPLVPRVGVCLDELSAGAAQTLWGWLVAEAGWPHIGVDLVAGARVLPQTGLDQQVVSFSKGCYLGQEVVARIRTYGSVPEGLRALVWGGMEVADLGTLPSAGAALIECHGGRIGAWAGTYWSAVLQRVFSLVFLNREHRVPGQTLVVETLAGSGVGEVAVLPLHAAANAGEQAAALHDRALVHFNEGRDEQAVVLLEQALRLDPTRAEAFEALGVILGRLEKYHEAIDIFRRLEEVAPDEPMVHTNLSVFYMHLGDKEEAERQKVLGTMKRFGVGVDAAKAAAMAAAELAARQADAQRKQVMFGEVLALDPDDPLALMGMGQAALVLNDLPVATDYLTRALASDQDNSTLYATLGKALAAANRTAEAREIFTRGIVVASRRGDLMPLRDMESRLRLLG